MPEGKQGGGGSIYYWQRVKETILERILTPARVLSVFSSFYLSLYASKQCRDRLGVGLSSRYN
jgi:hypothetical protein